MSFFVKTTNNCIQMLEKCAQLHPEGARRFLWRAAAGLIEIDDALVGLAY